MISSLVPGIFAASTKMISPPLSVRTRPVATPTRSSPSMTSRRCNRRPSQRSTSSGVTVTTYFAPPPRLSRAILRQMVAMRRSRLRIPASRVYSRMIVPIASGVKVTWSLAETLLPQLLRAEEARGDLRLLLLGVARELDDLEPVEQRLGDRIRQVDGDDEEHPREVEGHIEVVVEEGAVLLGIEHFEQRRGRVPLDLAADLVELVEHQHRVGGLHAADLLDHPARLGAGVGAPVAADVRLVADSPEADP